MWLAETEGSEPRGKFAGLYQSCRGSSVAICGWLRELVDIGGRFELVELAWYW